ncbi:MAG TPA: protein tyrosine phosphatase family protein [Longimicrobiales bacterium]|nr:protein tyrosine phosphatase family protein [Longimicrobiales bacterium]
MTRSLALPTTILLSAVPLSAAHAQRSDAPPLETIRNFQVISERLASAGQIGYEQIPLLRQEGYEVVVNLATADAERNAEEGFLVTQTGLTYVQIPVVWQAPTVEDVEMFFDVMDANRERKIFVHCIANMRASAFIYLYRTLVEGVPEAEARATMNAVWDPSSTAQWAELIERVRSTRPSR